MEIGITEILNSENLDPRVTLIVGDRSYNVVGGKKNKLLTAAVSYGYDSREELTSSKPDFICDTISDLATFIESESTGTEVRG